MKSHILILLALLAASCTNNKKSYTDEIKMFQYKLNTEFSNKEESPLTEKDFNSFKSLEFFTIDKNYRVKATITLTPKSPIFEMQTTTDRLPLYKKYGIAKFELNGEKLELSIFQNQDLKLNFEYKNYLFIPFNDATNGKLSYSGGRYIDLEIPQKKDNNTIIIDFNKSYNPYCAYNNKFSCPVPPSENILPIEINAGIKLFKH
ncbi:DUF1684 domain-containing protein [Lutibacter citreus]|uniref:DUF1684 domain-containing protein n=1 Tax=Lutibacter citreus TaxID=2138210 RepID=UPI000DBE8BAC|nr:DUF1684 domain-containing protein [Lutibacter citreus]